MVEHKSPKELEARIGYPFCDETILKTALTRKMHLNDIEDKKSECMKPLATVGDAILGAAVVSWLYENGTRDSETLTKERSRKVKREKTRDAAKNLGLECYILWGNGEEKNEVWDKGTQAFDTAFEALIGAVFLDAKKSGSDGLAAVNRVLKQINFFE